MMILVSISRHSGMFEYLAVSAQNSLGANSLRATTELWRHGGGVVAGFCNGINGLRPLPPSPDVYFLQAK
jgi:hypothetical protein